MRFLQKVEAATNTSLIDAARSSISQLKQHLDEFGSKKWEEGRAEYPASYYKVTDDSLRKDRETVTNILALLNTIKGA